MSDFSEQPFLFQFYAGVINDTKSEWDGHVVINRFEMTRTGENTNPDFTGYEVCMLKREDFQTLCDHAGFTMVGL